LPLEILQSWSDLPPVAKRLAGEIFVQRWFDVRSSTPPSVIPTMFLPILAPTRVASIEIHQERTINMILQHQVVA
jgi:hypothetical protein